MATYSEIAPEISQYVSQAAAEDFAENAIEVTAPVYKELGDLNSTTRNQFFQWLKWFGMKRRPGGLPEWINLSPRQVAAKLGFTLSYVNARIAERNAIIAEVRQWGEDAFEEHPVQPRITTVVLNSPEEGDVTINGTDFDSIDGETSGVIFNRPAGGSVTRTMAEIISAGGAFSETQIVVKAASIPLALQVDDEISVGADGLTSNIYYVTG